MPHETHRSAGTGDDAHDQEVERASDASSRAVVGGSALTAHALVVHLLILTRASGRGANSGRIAGGLRILDLVVTCDDARS
jgi:hypothetical protein